MCYRLYWTLAALCCLDAVADAPLRARVRQAHAPVLTRLALVVGGRGARERRDQIITFVRPRFWHRARDAVDMPDQIGRRGSRQVAHMWEPPPNWKPSRWSDRSRFPDRPGFLAPLGGGAVNEATKSGKWSETTTWSLKKVPEAKEDVAIGTSIEVKVEAAAVCRALLVKKKAKITGASSITVGNSEEPGKEFAAEFKKFALVIESEVTWTGTNLMLMNSTFAGEVKMSMQSECGGSMEFGEKTSASKYTLAGQLKVKSFVVQKKESFLNTAGFAVAVNSYSNAGAKVTLEGGKSVWTLPVPGVGLKLGATEATYSLSEATFVLTGSGSGVEAALGATAATIGTIKMETASHTWATGAVEWTVKTLEVTKAGAEVKFSESIKIKGIESLVIVGSKAGTLTTFLCTTAGKTFTLEFTTAVTVKNLKLKDCHATAAHEPTDEVEGVTSAELKGTNVEFWKFSISVILTTTAQGQTVSAPTKEVGASRSLSQAQVVSKKTEVSATRPTVAQAQTISKALEVGAIRPITQGQSVALAHTITRLVTFTATQAQAVVKVMSLGLTRALTQAQAVGKVLEVGSTLQTRARYARIVKETTGLVNYWRLNESEGTVARDQTGAANGEYGAFLGASLTLGETGPLSDPTGRAVYLHGTYSGGAEGATASVLFGKEVADLNERLTVEVWANFVTFEGPTGETAETQFEDQRIFSNMSEFNNEHGYALTNLGNGKIAFYVQGATQGVIVTTAALTTGGWHHIVATYDKGTVKLFIDGKEAAVKSNGVFPVTIPYESGRAVLGGRCVSAGLDYIHERGANAKFGELAVYNVALTSATVKEHYDAKEGDQGQTVTLTKQRAANRALECAQTQAVSATRAIGKNFALAQSGGPTLVRQAGKGLSLTQGQGVTFTRSPTIARTLSQPQAIVRTVNVGISRALSQAQVVTLRKDVGYMLTPTQPQAVSNSYGTTHSFALTQPQTTSRTISATRSFTLAQAQAVTRATTTTRLLALTQGQAPSYTYALGRTMAVTQAQAVSLTRSAERTLALEQAQAPRRSASISTTRALTQPQTPRRVDDVARSLAAAQAQEPSHRDEAPRSLPLTQGQSVSMSERTTFSRILEATQVSLTELQKTPSRHLSVAQTQSVLRSESVGYFFSASQSQVPTVEYAVEKGEHEGTKFNVTLTVAQPQEAAKRVAAGRTLRLTQAQVVTNRERSLTHRLTISQGQAARLARSATHTLTVSQGQMPMVEASPTQLRTLEADQHQGVTRTCTPLRILRATQTQTARLRIVGFPLSCRAHQTTTVAYSSTRTFPISQHQTTITAKAVSETFITATSSVIGPAYDITYNFTAEQAQVATIFVHLRPVKPGHLSSSTVSYGVTTFVSDDALRSSSEPEAILTSEATGRKFGSAEPAIDIESSAT